MSHVTHTLSRESSFVEGESVDGGGGGDDDSIAAGKRLIHIDYPKHFPKGMCMCCSVLQCVEVRSSVLQ